MTRPMLDIRKQPDGIVFKIHVQPKASKNAIVGLHDDALKIRLTAPPVDGAANKMCAAFLAKVLGVPKSSVAIVSGLTSRNKQVCVTPPQDASAQLMETIKNLAERNTA